MDAIKTVLLGVLQGATEFLPVSSSGHLVAAQRLLGVDSQGVVLEVALHFGTLLAIVVVFWPQLVRLAVDSVHGTIVYIRTRDLGITAQEHPHFPMALAIVAGSIPTGIAGILLEEPLGRVFDSVTASGAFIMVTGILLLLSRYAREGDKGRVTPLKGLVIGVAQSAALLPGISRSGSTIVAGYFVGLRRDLAARFSFLLAVPAMVGATALEARHFLSGDVGRVPPAGVLLLGMLASAVVGTVCLLALLRLVQRGKLHWFAAYCLPVGALIALAGVLG